MSKRLEVNYAGVHFKNPVALASGTCGFGKEMNVLIFRDWEDSVPKG